ncbi:MAG: hypothetical protein ACK4N5_10150, partial [Myxococcales bacterium]
MALGALLLALLPCPVHAVPALRLLVPGDAQHVATGGTDVFLNFDAEPERLFRPARLHALRTRRLTGRIEDERLIEINDARFSGTRAADRRMALYGYAPVEVEGRTLGVAGSFRQDVGLSRLRDRVRGLSLELAESRGVGALAVGGKLHRRLSAGASLEYAQDAGFGYLAEVRAAPEDYFTVSFRHGLRRARYMVAVPQLGASALELPALSWDVHQTRRMNEVLLELGTADRGFLRASFDFANPHRVYAELVSPSRPLIARFA